MSTSWFKKPKATQVPTPLYYDTNKLMSSLQGDLSAGYKKGIEDRNAQYTGVKPLAEGLLSYGNRELSLGGEIDPETQAQVVRGALSNSASAGILPGTLGNRGLVARDLGLTSMDLRNSRAKNAAGVLDMSEFRAPEYSDKLAEARLGLEMGNTDMGNQWIYNQLGANEAVKGKDSFVGGLAKGLATTATYGALDNATKSM